MRPDMEDYAEIDEGKSGPGSRAMSWMVLAVAVGGFTALAYYAYHSGTSPAVNGETMTVEADPSPIKSAPESADGEQFANKDKTIYDVIAPNGEAGKVEKLLPDPEHPVAAANVEDSEDDVPTSQVAAAAAAGNAAVAAAPAPATTTFVAGDAHKADPLDKVVSDGKSATAAPVPAQTVSEQPVATIAKPVAEAKPVEKSYASPQMINEKPKKEEAKAAAKPVAKPKAVTATAGGAYKVQLGAFKSEAEAEAAWKKISSAHSDVLSGSPTIVKAEVNGGTFYRLRTGSYANAAEAKAACAKLGGQACMPVK